ncbi:hypothetical protein CAEBREN_12396 [Caenorhabditis brenneri]|uniref:Receptor L-domain domain-containing protein n=1 Tax=Caenorhabditis brenneri TaxID=135651 RepID=G0M9Q6_CAEBE|nr:hypothetical protein CAEBREN_12396 [Caenorhabditis brenneri]
MYFINTQYASIEFFLALEEVHCEVLNVFSFAFNRNLEVLNFGNLTKITCDFYAYNNSRLDATSFCEKFDGLTIMFVYENYKSCKGCIATSFYSNTLYQFQGCTSIINVMWFSYFYTDYDPPVDMSPLKDILNISGSLAFVNTDLKNLSFFENLENIRSNTYMTYDIDIEQCYNMTRFELPALKTISTTRDHFLINVDRAHEDFCFTTTEMYFFLVNNVKFAKLDANYCVNVTLDSICFFDTMSNLKDNCTEILGDVILGAKEEVYQDKLKNLRNVYGSLTIQGTTLTNLSFLGSLEYVAILGNASTIPLRIESNKNLQNVIMPNLKRVFSKTRYQIMFQDNGNNFLNSSACLNLMANLFDTNVVFDGKECGEK